MWTPKRSVSPSVTVTPPLATHIRFFVGRILRFLATHHYFNEVMPDVFANNRLSSVLDTGKSVAEIHAK